MARTAQISKEKQQSITTLRHKVSRTLKVSSSAVAKTTIRYEDPELPLPQRLTSLELPASEIAAQINASQSSSNRHNSTSIVQRRLCKSGLHGRIATKKPLLKDINKKKRLAWVKSPEQWTLDRWKSVLWSD